MRERPILIAYRRFEQLQELLFARGYLVDPGGRDPHSVRKPNRAALAESYDVITEDGKGLTQAFREFLRGRYRVLLFVHHRSQDAPPRGMRECSK